MSRRLNKKAFIKLKKQIQKQNDRIDVLVNIVKKLVIYNNESFNKSNGMNERMGTWCITLISKKNNSCGTLIMIAKPLDEDGEHLCCTTNGESDYYKYLELRALTKKEKKEFKIIKNK